MSRILEQYLTEKQTARELGHSERTLRSWRQRGEGPPFVKLGRKVMYAREAVLTWLRQRQQSPARRRAA